MFRYKGVDCPVCKKELTEKDEIAVCPECGAPYHKDCVKETGCVLTEFHEKGENWTPPEIPKEDIKFDGNLLRRCSRCGTVNPLDRNTCELCGTALNNSEGIPSENNGDVFQNYIPFNPFINPLGGVHPDEEIEEIPVKDLALFVRENSHHYIPRFKSVSKTGKGGFSWSAFLFDTYFFIYRKMWGMAVIAFIVTTILSVPQFFTLLETGEAILNGATEIAQPSQIFWTANQVCSFLSFAFRFLLGVFANKIYASKCFKTVKKLKKEHGESKDYSAILAKKGGTSKIALIISFAVTYLFSMILSAIVNLI